MEPRGRARHRWANRKVEWSFGKSDIEGKVARVAARKRGHDRVSNGREHMSQRGQRVSFNQHDEHDTDCEATEAKLGEEFRVPGVGCDHRCASRLGDHSRKVACKQRREAGILRDLSRSAIGDRPPLPFCLNSQARPRKSFARGKHARVIALLHRSSRPPGMPDAFDRAPLR
jgi:hypothetical protein